MIGVRRRSLAAVSLICTASFALAPAAAWAAPDGRIQQVETTPGSVSFVLSAQGLAEGQSIEPASVKVRIAGNEVPATAAGASDATQSPSRTVMLALDSSGSMAQSGKLQKAKDAAKSYLAGVPDDVRVGLISFADDAKVKVSPTLDHKAVEKAISGLSASGATALNDAVVLTVDKLGKEGSRNAVLLSDGEDEGSRSSAEAAQKRLAESGIVLDAVSLGTGAQQKQLAAFTKAGDGTLVTATDAAGLTAAFQQAARTLGTQLAVVATVPGNVPEGTNSLDVTATAGGVQIHDSAVTVLQPAPVAAPTVAHGPVVVADPDPGILAKSWVLIVTILVLFAALLTITSIAMGAVDPQNRRAGRISRRLEGATVLGPTREEVVIPETVLGGSLAVRKAVSFADKVAESRRTTVIATKLEQANVNLRPGEWVVVHGLIAILAGLITTLLSDFNLMASVIAFAAGLALPWAYLERRAAGRRAKFYADLPDALQMLAGSLQAGYSLPQGVDNVARENSGPLGEEVNRALLESRLGLPLEDALEASAQRMRSQDFHWVVMALRINRRIGGNLAEVLTNVGATLRERERLRRQVKALSAEGVLSAWVLGLLPVGIGAFVMITRPAYLLPLFTTPVGWAMLAVGIALYLIGILWMRNLVTMEV